MTATPALNRRGWKSNRGPAAVGRCRICGRADVPLRQGLREGKPRAAFHYSPAPCELPCVGGPVGDPEDHLDGIHAKDCRRCRKAERTG